MPKINNSRSDSFSLNHVCTCMQRSEVTFLESILSFYHIGSKDPTQGIRIGIKR